MLDAAILRALSSSISRELRPSAFCLCIMAAAAEWNKLLADVLVPKLVVSGLKSLGYDS